MEEVIRRLREVQAMTKLVGNSPTFVQAIIQVPIIAKTEAAVLICGETGTGKELVARAIHDLSGRSKGSFVKVNCAAIPASLLESELFGHEKGAFTGAHERRIGRFEQANGGTLFLDEIAEIDSSTQVTLDGQTASAEQLPAGAEVRASFRTDSGEAHATRIEAKSR